MKFNRLIFLFLLLAGCKGCDDSPTPPQPEKKKPAPISDGTNTFYCEINGKPYYQTFVGGQPSVPRITVGASNTEEVEGLIFNITYPAGDNSEYIKFSGYNIRTPKRILFQNDTNCHMNYFRKNSCDYSDSFMYNSSSGFINFSRYDHANGIYSGTFELKIWLPDSVSNGCDTVRITNGIFDLKS